MNVEQVLIELKKLFSRDETVAAVYLFGSQAKGKPGPLSDIDIAVLLGAEVPEAEYSEKQLDMLAGVSRLLKTNRVDLVILNIAPVLLAHRVLGNGCLVFCRDDYFRAKFQAETIRDYLDTKPLRSQNSAELFKRIRENRFAS